jgi:4-amino-4-deoxy-L-arabinose transferase-like glycosyltransferase
VFRHCLLLLAICALTFFAGLGRGAIGDSDEAFYAESGREMIESGDWITPHYNYEYRFQKPILFYWLAAGTYRVAGVDEAAARFPSALAGLALTLMTFFCGLRWFGSRTGLLAGAIVATSFGYFSMGRTALPDLPLAFFIATATWTLIEATFRSRTRDDSGREATTIDRQVDGDELSSAPALGAQPRASAAMRGVVSERLVLAGVEGASLPDHVFRERSSQTINPAAASGGREASLAGSMGSGAGTARGAMTGVADSAGTQDRGLVFLPMPGRLSWLLAAAVAMALGVLTKGPVALALPVMVLIPLALIAGDTWKPSRRGWFGFSWGQLAIASLVFLLVAIPWFAAMAQTHGLQYLRRFFIGENLERFATDRYNDPRPVWFYVPIVLGGLAPWTAFMFLWLPGVWRWVRQRAPMAQVDWRLILWAAMPFLFYTASIGKQPRYILPILPPLALLLARTILARMDRASASGRRDLGLAICGTATALGFVLTSVLLYRARPLLFALSPMSGMIGTTVMIVAGTALAGAAWLRRHTLLPITQAAAATAALVALHYSVYTTADLEPVQRMARIFAENRQANEPSGTYHAFVRNLVFYTGVKQTDLIDEAEAVAFFTQSQRVLCVAPEQLIRSLQQKYNLPLHRLGTVLYFNPAGLRLRTLLSPQPERDLETVWLVTNH